jgi:hypothetical protein
MKCKASRWRLKGLLRGREPWPGFAHQLVRFIEISVPDRGRTSPGASVCRNTPGPVGNDRRTGGGPALLRVLLTSAPSSDRWSPPAYEVHHQRRDQQNEEDEEQDLRDPR